MRRALTEEEKKERQLKRDQREKSVLVLVAKEDNSVIKKSFTNSKSIVLFCNSNSFINE